MNTKTLLNYKTKAGQATKPPFHLLVSPAQDVNTLSESYILRVTALGHHSLLKATQTVALMGYKKRMKHCSFAEGSAAKCHLKYRGMDCQSSIGVLSFHAECQQKS